MTKVFENRYRYLVLATGCLGLTSISSNMLAFNIAQVCMGSEYFNHTNQTCLMGVPLDYTPYEVSLINLAVAIGAAIATLMFSEAYVRIGTKWPFFVAGMLSVFATALIPFAAEFHFYALLAFRFLQGISFAADFAAVGSLCSSWASLKQNGLFLGFLTAYSPASSALTNWIGGVVCKSSYGWPMVFYVHAISGFVVFVLWFLVYCDKPQDSRKVSPIELEKIQRNKNRDQINGTKKIPYKSLLTDVRIWSIWFSAFAEIFSTSFLSVHSPYYIKNVLQYSVEETGNFSALSRLVQIPVRLICGEMSDRITFLSENLKLIVFNTITVGGAGVSFAAIGFMPKEYPILPIIGFCMVNVMTGSASGGFYKAAVLYSRQYSHFVIATCQFLRCIALFLGPAMVAVFIHDEESQSQWKVVFLIIAAFLFMATIIFCVFSTSEPAVYTDEYFVEKKTASVYIMETGVSKKNGWLI
ncbi:MFS domain-containing protein [Aphelenchoides besseyi]|nr:MFS domain-containing protein [Aphelenchoides besseyi]